MNNIQVELNEYNNKYSTFTAGLDEYIAVSTITKQWRHYLDTRGYRQKCRAGVVGRRGEPRQCRNKLVTPQAHFCARHAFDACRFDGSNIITTRPYFYDKTWRESVIERKREFKRMMNPQKLTGCLIDDI